MMAFRGTRGGHTGEMRPMNATLAIHTKNKFCLALIVILQENENKRLNVCINKKREKTWLNLL